MRLTSSIFVSALLRRCNAASCFAVLRQRGAEVAGAIFIKADRLDGSCNLYGPAPPDFQAEDTGGRRFSEISAASGMPLLQAEERLRRECSFDPDLWIIEIEDHGGGRHREFLDIAER